MGQLKSCVQPTNGMGPGGDRVVQDLVRVGWCRTCSVSSVSLARMIRASCDISLAAFMGGDTKRVRVLIGF